MARTIDDDNNDQSPPTSTDYDSTKPIKIDHDDEDYDGNVDDTDVRHRALQCLRKDEVDRRVRFRALDRYHDDHLGGSSVHQFCDVILYAYMSRCVYVCCVCVCVNCANA